MDYKERQELFGGKDVLYHYTKFDTALEYILPYEQLKFNFLNGANDPMEKTSPFLTIGFNGHLEEEKELKQKYDYHKIRQTLLAFYNEIKQICLCENREVQEDKNTGTEFFDNIRDYGFAKLRMWDQYAENYKGVCFVLSKSGLLNQLDCNCKSNRVIYDEIQCNTVAGTDSETSILLNKIEELGEEEYVKRRKDMLLNTLFTKDIDYLDESEFKILSSGNDIFLNIANSIKGIIYTNLLPEWKRSALLDFCNKKQIATYKLNIRRDGIDICKPRFGH